MARLGHVQTAPVEELVEHLSMISDAMADRDIEIFRDLAATDLDRAEVDEYWRLRSKSPDFQRRSWDGGCPAGCDGDPHLRSCTTKSHRAVIAEWRQFVKINRKPAPRSCEVCGKPVAGRARTCGPKCRKALSRRK